MIIYDPHSSTLDSQKSKGETNYDCDRNEQIEFDRIVEFNRLINRPHEGTLLPFVAPMNCRFPSHCYVILLLHRYQKTVFKTTQQSPLPTDLFTRILLILSFNSAGRFSRSINLRFSITSITSTATTRNRGFIGLSARTARRTERNTYLL